MSERMKIKRYIQLSLLMALLIGWGCLLTNCSDRTDVEAIVPDEPTGEPLRIVSMTRNGTDEESETTDPLVNKDVKLFLAPLADADGTTYSPSGVVTYQGKGLDSGDLTTGSTLLVKPGRDYRIFGWMPASAAEGSTVKVNGNTATMTIEGLPLLAGPDADVCIITGVKAGALAENEKVTAGQFEYHAPEDTEEGYRVSLLADHLYAAMELKFLVHSDYTKLRRIFLKKVTLKSSVKEKVTATISLQLNAVGNNPIDGAPTFSSPTGKAAELELFKTDKMKNNILVGDELKVAEADAITMSGFFAAQADYISTLQIESEYDVYDLHGADPIRKDCKAMNNLSSVLSGISCGQKKVLKLTVQPTYLYVLSDNDTDPVVTIDSE